MRISSSLLLHVRHLIYNMGIKFFVVFFFKRSAILLHVLKQWFTMTCAFQTYTHHISFFPSDFCTFSLCIIIIPWRALVYFFNFKFLVFIFDSTSLVMWLQMLFLNSFQSVCSFCKLNEFYVPSTCL